MKFFFVLIILLSTSVYTHEMPYKYFLFIDVDHCLQCNQTIINSTIERLREQKTGKVIAVLSTNSSDDYTIYCKQLDVDSCIYDTLDLFKRCAIKNQPTLIVTSQSGYELYRCENINRYNSDVGEILKKISRINNKDIQQIVLEKNDNSILGKAYQPIIDFRNNTLYTVDELQNEIAGYSIVTGKRLLTIKPPSKAEELAAMKKALPQVFGLEAWGIPFSKPKENRVKAKFQQVTPTMNFGTLSILLSVETEVADTSILPDGTISLSKHNLGRTITTTYSNNQIQGAYIPATEEYAASYLKYREPILYSNLSYGFIRKNHRIPEDSLSPFFISRIPTLEQGKYFLNYGRLKKEYGLTTFNTLTLGVLEYNQAQKGFIYMNHWNHIFCKILLRDTIIKFQFSGLLHCAVPNNPKPLLLTHTDTMRYFVNDIFSNSRHFFVLIQPYSPQKSSDYYIIQRYNWDGTLEREIPIYCDDDKILRINIAGCTEESLYVLVKLAKKGHILQKLSVKE